MLSSVEPEDVEALVRRWLAVAATKPVTPAARRLAQVLRDPEGLAFTVGFVDRVVRPEDARVAATGLRRLARRPPRFLPVPLRAALRLGALASLVAPGLVIPAVRRVLRGMVGHLLVDAGDARLGRAIGRIRARGVRLNVNLLGEAVLGAGEARRRLEGTMRLMRRPDVDYVSIKVSAAVPPHAPWAFDQAVAHIEESLLPLFRLAAAESTFVNLDMEEYRDLDLTIAVFTRLLDRPELADLEAGIVLQAYLPDALGAMMRLQQWAAARRARGGAGIKVRLVKGANLPMERVDAELHGWPLATWPSKAETDAGYLRVLDWALHPARTANVRIGVAGHNLFDIAHAWLLAGERGVRDRVELEMLLGMAEGQAEAVRETIAREGVGLLLYTPVVHPREFDVAIAYLVRRLEEGASEENFMSAVFDLHDDPALFERERARYRTSLALLSEHLSEGAVPRPRRTQDRRDDEPAIAAVAEPGFTNTPDSDPALPGNRAWAAEVLQRVPASRLGEELVERHRLTDPAVLDDLLASTAEAAADWGKRSGAERAAVLRRAAAALEQRRAELLEAMAAECGKTLDQGDPEVSEAVDFARYYAQLAEELDAVDGAVAEPVRLTVVTPPWNFPLAIPAGSTLAALAAGSAVVVKPATQARRCGSLMVETLWRAGVPEEVLRLVHVEEGELGRQLIAHPEVDRLILTGAFETAELFRSFRPELPLLAETSGKNAIVVTPHADLDLAVRDLVASAFGHAGQKCSAASLGILVGSVSRSRRFRDQLVDAVSSLRIGLPADATSQVGPLIDPAHGKLLRAVTQLGPGERWLVPPLRLDDEGRLWSPGVKTGVAAGSEFHRVECFGPVLGLMTAADLDEAIELQNGVDYGLTAGLHSLDRGEVAHWLDRVEAGNLYVNRGITGAIVRRQPFGGWKRSAVGAGTKAGGPSYLIGLTGWRPAPAAVQGPLGPTAAGLLTQARGLLSEAELAFLTRSLGSDAAVWAELGSARDVSGLAAERNWLRHLPVPVLVRVEEAGPAELLRVVAAGLLVGAPVRVSAAAPLSGEVVALLRRHGVSCQVADATAWADALRRTAAGRVRLLGGDPRAFAAASGGRVDLALYPGPVLEAGRVELLTFLREQAVSVTAHRFGSPTPLVEELL